MKRPLPSIRGTQALSLVLALSALSMAGIVGMLIAGAALDRFFFFLSSLPWLAAIALVRRPKAQSKPAKLNSEVPR